jgi:hypothetical protein
MFHVLDRSAVSLCEVGANFHAEKKQLQDAVSLRSLLLTSSPFVCLAFAALGIPLAQGDSEESWMTIVPSGSGWVVQSGTNGCATAQLKDHKDSSGWYVLDLLTNSAFSDNDQAYCAGFLEAALTQQQIWDSWRNNMNGTSANISLAMANFITEQDAWVRQQAAEATSAIDTNGEYWIQVGLSLAQLDGLFDGYNAYSSSSAQLSYTEFLYYTLAFEVGDIQSAINEANTHSMSMHCSVLIKPSPNNEELYQSHDTWDAYSTMLRVYKHYTFNFNTASNLAPSVSFSSYFGNPYSGDDFYITSANLVVLETTNSVYNMSLYNYVTTHTVPYWIRILVANRMAACGERWSEIFARHNSGTYNNQWMIVDNKLVESGMDSYPPNTLWVLEQIPGFCVSDDLTSVLNAQGYWASYNVPYFPFIYDISGYGNPIMCGEPKWCSYENCSRANIFRRVQDSVVDLASYKHVMRYNQWQTDPFSLRDACASVSARCDLNVPWATHVQYQAYGGIDNKLTTNKWSASRRAEIVCGPTWDSQPPFAWTEQWSSTNLYYGMPTVFAFDYVEAKPSTPN